MLRVLYYLTYYYPTGRSTILKYKRYVRMLLTVGSCRKTECFICQKNTIDAINAKNKLGNLFILDSLLQE